MKKRIVFFSLLAVILLAPIGQAGCPQGYSLSKATHWAFDGWIICPANGAIWCCVGQVPCEE